MTGARLRYRPELDGLRAIAVVLVIVHHVLQPHRFSGFLGVDVFFVLSGYLITTLLLAEYGRSSRIDFGVFYVRRLLRLYPALLTMLIVVFPLFPFMAAGGGALVQVKRWLIAATYTGNVYMTYRHEWLGPLTHTWSLALEEQYYLVWPLVLVALLRIGMRRSSLCSLLMIGAIASAVFSVRDFSFNAAQYPIQSTCGGLLLGSALAVFLMSSPTVVRRCASRWVAIGGVLALTAPLVAFSLTTAIPAGAYVPIAEAGTALVIAHTTGPTQSWTRRVLAWQPAVALGRISYGVYLWHYPLVLLCAHELPHWPLVARLGLVMIASMAAATLSYRVVEVRFLRLKDRLGRHDDAGETVQPPRGERQPLDHRE